MYRGGGFEPFSLAILIFIAVLYTGFAVLAGVKRAYSDEDRKSKQLSGGFAVVVGLLGIIGASVGAYFFWGPGLFEQARESNETPFLTGLLAIISVMLYIGSMPGATFFEEESVAGRAIGGLGTIIFGSLTVYLIIGLLQQ